MPLQIYRAQTRGLRSGLRAEMQGLRVEAIGLTYQVSASGRDWMKTLNPITFAERQLPEQLNRKLYHSRSADDAVGREKTMRNQGRAIALAFTAVIVMAAPTYAAEGAATGNGTSTVAGPAADNGGPTKSPDMSSGHHMKKMKHHHKSM